MTEIARVQKGDILVVNVSVPDGATISRDGETGLVTIVERSPAAWGAPHQWTRRESRAVQ